MLNILIFGMVSLNEDQPGEIIDSSKSSTKASACVFARGRVPLPAQTPIWMGAPLEDEDVVEPEELEGLPPDELLDEPEPIPPEELPLPEPPLDELFMAGGAEPLEHPPARQTLAARRETRAVVGIFF